MTSSSIQTFGEYLYSKRSPLMTMKALANRLEISPGYVCDIENDRKDPPSKEILEKIAEILALSNEDRTIMFDLAGKGRQEVSADLPDYIMNSEVSDTVRLALRTAKNRKASVEDWLRFVDEMLEKPVSDLAALS